ncbi:phosphatidic acid phosphatase [Achlya hypogyna]|uniref:Phosphatidic acid phosphatase n=1 Tax=Achlya hypogyna TaxID=1202772 RepID=A0A1V9Z367_ACHHY|nr:phosphatidic acid phosphatase [Achlya hypogyna]
MGWQEALYKFRVAEFATSTIMLLVSLGVALAGIYRRDLLVVAIPISQTETIYVRDPSVNLKKLDQQVPMYMAVILSYGIPVVAHFALQWHRRIAHDTRDFFLSLFVSSAICQLVTNIAKALAGRFRPSFYDMCKWDTNVVWDGKANLCKDSAGETEGRKSFPSGHSSTAFSTLFFLTLYLIGRFHVMALHKYSESGATGRHLLANVKFFVAVLPSILALWIAVTRSMDNWHHYSDIAAGSFIGIVSAMFAYAYNYAPLFNYKSSGLPLQTFYEQKTNKGEGDDSSAHLNAA